MKTSSRFFHVVVAAAFLTVLASESSAQTSFSGVTLVSPTGSRLELTYDGLTDGDFTIPDGGGSAVPAGAASNTLAWIGTEWQAMTNLLNDGTDVTLASGNLGLTSGNLTLSSGTLRVSTTGTDLAATFTITNASSTEAALRATTNGTIASTGVYGQSNNGTGVYGNSSSYHGVLGTSTSGIAVGAFSNIGTGLVASSFSGRALRAYSGENVAARFENTTASNANPTVEVENQGLGNAGKFMVTNTDNDQAALLGVNDGDALSIGVNGYSFNGSGVVGASENGAGVRGASVNSQAGYFTTTGSSNSNPTISATTLGTGQAFYATQQGATGVGVYIQNVTTSNPNYVLEVLANGTGPAGMFSSVNTTSIVPALMGTTTGTSASSGVAGSAGDGTGVYGTSTAGKAGYFQNSTGSNGSNALEAITNGSGRAGLFTVSNVNSNVPALSGITNGNISSTGVYGQSDDGTGVSGSSTNYIAVSGTSTNSIGGYFGSSSSTGYPSLEVSMNGTGNSGRFSISNTSSTSAAILAITNGAVGSIGLGATADDGIGVFSTSTSGQGVWGISTSNTGVQGESTSGTGVYGASSAGRAGFFQNATAANTNPTLEARTNGDGPAIYAINTGDDDMSGMFMIDNSSNSSNVLYAETNGSGVALNVVAGGTGGAGAFGITNPANGSAALVASAGGQVSSIGVQGTADNGVGVLGDSPEGIGVQAHSLNGTAIYTQTAEGRALHVVGVRGEGGYFELIAPDNENNALYAETIGEGSAGVFAILNTSNDQPALSATTNGDASSIGLSVTADDGTGISATSTSATAAVFNGVIGVRLAGGAFVGSYQDVNGGDAISINTSTANITDDAGATLPNVTLASGHSTGQLIMVCTDDDDGATINSTLTIPANGCITLLYTTNGWRQTQ